VALIGVVSYGLYLWHEAWINLFLRWTGDHLFGIALWQLFGFVTLTALVTATASYRLVERPLLRGGLRPRVRTRLRRFQPEPQPARPPTPATVASTVTVSP
jgi:peptidoglycan/LPS O-acetylase OafA/YrhL